MGIPRKTEPLAIAGRRQPLDDNPEWRRIYDALVTALGEPLAWSWFGNARFGELVDGRLTISQWNAFTAAECLRRHGHELAKASGASAIRVYRSGGYRPVHLDGDGRHRKGYEEWPHGGAA